MPKKYFVRANTAMGTVNLTESNLQGIEHIYILTGQSKFLKHRILKNIAKYTEENGKDIECAVSAFDISEYDAVILRDIKTAVVSSECIPERKKAKVIDTDGFLNKRKLSKYRELQKELYDKSQDAVLGLYSAYSAAKVIHDEWEKIYIKNMDFERLNRFEDGVLESLITARNKNMGTYNYERFFGASTPDGSVNYVESLTSELGTRYFIKGRPGTGKSTFLRKLLRKARENGYATETYYCSFDSKSLDMVVLPEMSFCVFDSTAPHELFPERDGDRVLDFYKESGLSGIDEKLESRLTDIKKLYSFRIGEGVSKLRLSAGYERETEYYFELAANVELADKTADKIVRKLIG